MANEVNIYSPRYLAEVVRQTPAVHTYFRDTFFTNVKTFATERVDIDLVKGDRRMAAFVHPRVGGKVLKANGYQTESYKPPLINPYDVTTADQLMTRLPGEDLYSGMTPAQRAAQKLMEEYATLNDATTRREEWMAVQAIVTGKIPIVGEGVNETIDFGLTNKKTLTGDNKWGGTKADILGNLGDWTDAVLHGGFANVDTIIMGKKAALRIPSTDCWNGTVGGPMTIYHDVAGAQTQTTIPVIESKGPGLFDRKIRSFLDAVKNGTPAPVPTSQILYNQAIIDHIVKSAELGHEVEVKIPEI